MLGEGNLLLRSYLVELEKTLVAMEQTTDLGKHLKGDSDESGLARLGVQCASSRRGFVKEHLIAKRTWELSYMATILACMHQTKTALASLSDSVPKLATIVATM